VEKQIKKAVKSDPGGRTKVSWTQATPEGSGSGLTAQFAAASTPSASSISKKRNKMQAEKKNPSDPDAVVTADAGVVLVAE
jgi:hypothetical protein